MLRPDFDPAATAEAEYRFWRAHHDKDVPRLRAALESWTSELYGLDPEASAAAVVHLVEASQHHDADERDKRDWDRATDCAKQYYAVVREHTDLEFDPTKAGELEVTWWQIHDELEFDEDKTRLVNAFSDLYAEVFGMGREQVLAAAEAHVQATVEHDRAEAGGVDPAAAEEHWQAAEQALAKSYVSLSGAAG